MCIINLTRFLTKKLISHSSNSSSKKLIYVLQKSSSRHFLFYRDLVSKAVSPRCHFYVYLTSGLQLIFYGR